MSADTVVTAEQIPWRPAMEAVLGILALTKRAETVMMIRRHTDLGEHIVRNALTDLVHKGLISRQDSKPVWYRINEHGKRTVDRNPERFGL